MIKKKFLLGILLITFSAYGMPKICQQLPALLQQSKTIGNLLTAQAQQGSYAFMGPTVGAVVAISYFLHQQKVYAEEDSSKSPPPTVEELFKHAASYQAANDANELELSKNPTKTKQYLNLAKEHFSALYKTSHGAYFLEKLLEKDKKAVSDFTQLAIDNLALVAQKPSGRDLIAEIVRQNSSYLDCVRNNNNPVIKQLIDKAEQNFAELITKHEGLYIVEMLAKKNSEACLRFATALSNNIAAIFEATYKKPQQAFTCYFEEGLLRLIKKHPHIQEVLQKHVEENVEDILSHITHSSANYDTVEFFLFLMNLNKHNRTLYAKALIEDLKSHKRTYKSLSNWYLFRKFFVDENEELFLSHCIQDLEHIFSNSHVTQFMIDAMKNNPIFTYQVGRIAVEKLDALSHFESFYEQYERNRLLDACAENLAFKGLLSKTLCEKFTDVKNICKNKNITRFIDTMLEKHPAFSLHISTLLTKNFAFLEQLNQDEFFNIATLFSACLKSPQNKDILSNDLINTLPNIEIICKNRSLFVLSHFMLNENDTNFVTHMTMLLSTFFSSFPNSKKIDEISKDRLDKIISQLTQDEEKQKLWLSIALTNIPLSCEIQRLTELLYAKMCSENDDTLVDFIAQSILDNFSTIEKTEFGPLLAHICFKHTHALQEKWVHSVEQNIATASPMSVALASHFSPCNKQIKKWIEQHHTEEYDDVHTMLKIHAYADHCPAECELLKKVPKSTTLNYIERELKTHKPPLAFGEKIVESPTLVPYYIFHQWQQHFSLHDPFINHMIQQVIQKEDELKSEYYTFIHGQRHAYLPNEQLHTFLQCILNKQTAERQHLLLHVKELPRNPEDIKQEKKVRNTLLKNGMTAFEERERLLFVNWTFFANSSHLGSSSAYYIASDSNAEHITLTPEMVFALNKLEHLYPKYKNQLIELQQEFDAITNHGTCILLAIPKKTIKKHVYLAADGGPKRKIVIDGIGETDDINLIMETLEKYPEKIADTDAIEFCIPMTYDKKGALNPESGVKVFAFTAADQEKLEAYYIHQQEVFEEIKKDIEEAIK